MEIGSGSPTDQALRQRAAQARAMVEVALALTSSLDLSAVLERIVDHASVLLRAQRVAVAVLDGDGGPTIRFVAARGLSSAFSELRPLHWRDGTTAAAIAERRPVWSEDLLRDPAFVLTPATRRIVESEGYRAVLSVPLLTGPRTLGAIALYRDAPGSFSNDEVELLQALAAQASVAIENAELYAEAERRRREAEVMADLARDISASLDLDTILARVADGARDLCQADFARIGLRDPATGRIRSRHAPGTRTLLWKDFEIESGRGSGGHALASGKPFRTERYLEDPRITKDYRALAEAEGTVAQMVVPIESPEGTQGLLYVTNRSSRPFTDRDEAVLTRLATYAGAALRNAGLYHELRTAHQTLERSQAQLVQSERLRALGEMAAGVAHDFNNLLAVILGRSELLLRRATDPAMIRGLEAVRRAAQDGADTVRRIQEFTRTRRSRPFEPVNLAEVVQEAVDLMRPRWKDEAQSRGIHFDVRVGGEAPPVAGRPEELREVFTNIVANALDAMPGGGACELRLAADGEWAVVTARDTGVGMTEEDQRRVFEPFFTSKGPRGTGLGLSVSWSIVSRHGGTIQVESVPRAGTRFFVRLPATAAQGPPAPEGGAAAGLEGVRVLIIDDEPEVRAVLADMLSQAGCAVLEASDGHEGLARLSAEGADVVVSDLSMPGLSGWDVAAACRDRVPRVPLGLVTGWGDQLDPGRVAASGVRFLIAKPFRSDDAVREIRRALTRS